ncbi:DNA-binding protein [Bradyrhizobium sp. CCBAU 53338]|uniref:DNA-binding protein n=1 Tax=Bradyrhizobium sp. CCBAU 53338 TaxID=1325111 RepID=UPI00188CAFA5|nr:DNA-binding protein [Bradyrhizobium sp. CCBAU 53338]QOZ52954.1 DNA-binding protein [Bradyrhizobium sp. CCBAU 53338]
MMGREDIERVMLRIPRDMKAWLAGQAHKNCSSQNYEIVRAIRLMMEVEQRGAA